MKYTQHILGSISRPIVNAKNRDEAQRRVSARAIGIYEYAEDDYGCENELAEAVRIDGEWLWEKFTWAKQSAKRETK